MDAGVAAMEWIILFLMIAVDAIRIYLGLKILIQITFAHKILYLL